MLTRFPTDLELRAEGGLLLRLPTDVDVDAIAGACQDPDIARFTRVPSPYTVDDARWFVRMATDEATAGASLNLVVVEDGRLVGACGLPRVDQRDRSGEVGYWVAAGARGRGVATRAARAVCRWALEDAGIERLVLEAATINPGSNGVARALGFTLEGTLRQAAVEGGTDDPGRFDMNVWGLLPGELT